MRRRPGIKDIVFVGVQFLLFGLFLLNAGALTIIFPRPVHIAGLVLTFFGLLIMISGLIQLDRNLSAFPTPKTGSQLIEKGLYKYIRHPIYSGIIIAGIGFSVYSDSGFRLIITLFLLILFYFKSAYEEEKLSAVFPEYTEYKKRTGRFWPRLF